MSRPGTLLVAGVTARALAASAAAAGWRVRAVDAFGDLDLRAVAEEVLVAGRRGAWRAAARCAADMPGQAFAYASGLEHVPAAVEAFAHGRELLGNAPAVLARARDPLLLHRLLRAAGHASPATRAAAPRHPGAGAWLLKPRRSGGGSGVRPWVPGEPVPRTHVLQERLRGVAGSLVFLADGRRSAPLAVTRMLVGDGAFGARGFRYAGTLAGGAALLPAQDAVFSRAAAAAETLTRALGLVGLNGIDFIAARGEAHVLEVNPRWTAAVECLERALGASLFPLHVSACRGTLPPGTAALAARLARGAVHGKAYVFATRAGTVPRRARWAGAAAADLPAPGDAVAAGQAICTVFARAAGRAACRAGLAARAARVRAAVAPRRR